MESQATLLDPNRQFFFLMTEQAVRWRRVPRSKIMADQCAHMANLAHLANIEIAIIPHTAIVQVSPLNVFVVYDDRLVLAELFSGEVALRDPRDVEYHLNLFEFFFDRALTGSAAREFLNGVAEEFMRERD